MSGALVRDDIQQGFARTHDLTEREDLQILNRPRARRGNVDAAQHVLRDTRALSQFSDFLPGIEKIGRDLFLKLLASLLDLQLCLANRAFRFRHIGIRLANHAFQTRSFALHREDAGDWYECFAPSSRRPISSLLM